MWGTVEVEMVVGGVREAGGGRDGVLQKRAREQAASEHQLHAVVDEARSSRCHGRGRLWGGVDGGGKMVDSIVCALCVIVSSLGRGLASRQSCGKEQSRASAMESSRGMAKSSTVVVMSFIVIRGGDVVKERRRRHWEWDLFLLKAVERANGPPTPTKRGHRGRQETGRGAKQDSGSCGMRQETEQQMEQQTRQHQIGAVAPENTREMSASRCCGVSLYEYACMYGSS